MDILNLLQTIGICVGAVALVAIAIMLFMVISSFLPSLPSEDEDFEPVVVMPFEHPARRKRTRGKKEIPPTPDPEN